MASTIAGGSSPPAPGGRVAASTSKVLSELGLRGGRPARATLLGAVAESSHDAVLALDGEGRVTTASARAELVLGCDESWLRARRLSEIVVEQRRAELDGLVRAAVRGRDVFQHDTQVRRRDGRAIDVTVDLAPLRRVGGGEIVGVSAIVQDISARKRLERELRRQAERDPLTGLYNRRRFQAELQRATRLARRHGHEGAVIVLDVDGFKGVNDTRGHSAGDQLLRSLAKAIVGGLRETDVSARLGGDELAVLLPDTGAQAVEVAGKLLDVARRAVAPWQTTVSAGMAWFEADGEADAAQVLAAADQAMYAAKGLGGDRVASAPAAAGRPAATIRASRGRGAAAGRAAADTGP